MLIAFSGVYYAETVNQSFFRYLSFCFGAGITRSRGTLLCSGEGYKNVSRGNFLTKQKKCDILVLEKIKIGGFFMAIYSSIDTLSVVFKKIKLETIFEKLKFYPDNISSLFEVDENGECKHILNKGYKTVFKFCYNDIWFEGDLLNNDIELLNCTNYFTWKFDKIRVEFTGQALEFLRRENFNPDEVLQSKEFYESFGAEYTLTRCDFAFDFVNCKAENFYQIFDFVDAWTPNDNTISRKNLLTAKKGGISYERRKGSMNCLYLGKSGSDKMLRIYDKYMERQGKVNNINDIPYSFINENVESWFRVELQLRREYVPKLLFASVDKNLINQFYFVFDNFMLYDRDENGKYKVVKPFYDLYEWAKLQQLYKMQNESEKENGWNIDKAQYFLQTTGAVSSLQVVGHNGPISYLIDLERMLIDCQVSNEDFQKNRLKSLNYKCSADASRKNMSIDDWLSYFPKNERGLHCLDWGQLAVDVLDHLYLHDKVSYLKVIKNRYIEDMITNLGD